MMRNKKKLKHRTKIRVKNACESFLRKYRRPPIIPSDQA